MKKPRSFPRTDRRRAAILAMTAICLVPLIGILALTLDGGRLLLESRNAQAVADTAALAGAYSLQTNWGSNAGADTGGFAKKAAVAIAADNGYLSPTPVVNIPPSVTTNQLFLGQPGYVEVIVTKNVPRGFSSIWGSATLPLSARSVARANLTPYSPYSLLVLDPSASGAMTISGSAHVVATTGIQIDSSSSSAVNVNNMGYAQSSSINMVGGYVSSSGGYLSVSSGSPNTSDSGSNTIDPLAVPTSGPNSGVDPFPPPNPATLSAQSYNTYAYPPVTAINPGVYASQLHIASGQTVSLNPGIYYLQNGLLIDNNANVTGNGVMIYNTGTGRISAPISFQGGGQITLTAATTGPYAGLVIYQQRSSTTSMNIANGSTTMIVGTVYAPSATAIFAGGSSSSQFGSQFIVGQLNASNNANVGINWQKSNVVSRLTSALVE